MKIEEAKEKVEDGYGCTDCEYDNILKVLIQAIEALDGMMEIAETAMPDTFFQSDSRVVATRDTFAAFEDL